MPALAFFCPHSWRRISWPARPFGSPKLYLNEENHPSAEGLCFANKRKSLNLFDVLGKLLQVLFSGTAGAVWTVLISLCEPSVSQAMLEAAGW